MGMRHLNRRRGLKEISKGGGGGVINRLGRFDLEDGERVRVTVVGMVDNVTMDKVL